MKKQITVQTVIKYLPYVLCVVSVIILAILFIGEKSEISGEGYVLNIKEDRVTGIKVTGEGELHVVIPDGVVGIEMESFFGEKQIVSVVIPASVEYIGYHAFVNCESLERIEFQEDSSLTDIHTAAFEGCSSLTELKLPDGLTQIRASAFSKCTSLKSVTLPDSLVILGVSAFSGCTALEGITVPRSVRSVGAYCFSDCESLTEIKFEEIDGWSVSVNSYVGEKLAEACFTYNGVSADDVSWSYSRVAEVSVDVENGTAYPMRLLNKGFSLYRYGN